MPDKFGDPDKFYTSPYFRGFVFGVVVTLILTNIFGGS